MDSKYLFVLQVDAETLEDFDNLVELEHALLQKLPEHLQSDGHDFGSGQGGGYLLRNRQPACSLRGLQNTGRSCRT